MQRLAHVAWWLLALLVAGPVAAQEPEPSSAETEARALFETGTRAVNEGRFREAERDLTRSLDLSNRPATAFNLVVALRGLGALVRATEVCEGSLEPPDVALDEAQRREADAICTEIRAGLSALHVRAIGELSFELRLDGEVVGLLVPPDERTIPVDPGDHRVTVHREDRVSEHAISLPAGAALFVELRAPSPPSPIDVPLVVGLSTAGVLVVTGLVVLGVALGTRSSPSYDYPVVATLVRF